VCIRADWMRRSPVVPLTLSFHVPSASVSFYTAVEP
jgi:hypothetical protein